MKKIERNEKRAGKEEGGSQTSYDFDQWQRLKRSSLHSAHISSERNEKRMLHTILVSM